MKKFQKLFALFVVVLMVAGLMAACQSQEEEVGTPFTIGISNPFITSEYRTQMIDELIETNAEYMEKGLTNELVIESFNTDVAGQIEQIENLMNQGVDAILVNPGDAVALNSILEEAVQAGILVLSIDQEIEAEGVINVGHDQYEWAQISAEWFAEKLQTGDVVLIEGFIGHPANELRMSAVYDAFEGYDINVLASESGSWDEATGQQVMSNFLAAYPNLNGYWTQDGMAIGALEAVIAANPDPAPLGVGEARVKFLKLWKEMLDANPDFETIAVANAPGVNSTALRIAVELLQGRELDESKLAGQFGYQIVIPIPVVITPENFEEMYNTYVVEGGFPDSYLMSGIMTEEEIQQFFVAE